VRHLRRIALAVATAMLTMTGTLAVTPAATAAAPQAWDSVTLAPLAAWTCDSGSVCFWTGPDGTGSRCMWSGSDPDWTTAPGRCSWATDQNVKSVWNRGTSSSFTGVAFYNRTGYSTRKGCTKQGKSGNLAGTYQVHSHRWITGTCGS
jgi:Peptidase inhibitor family I36